VNRGRGHRGDTRKHKEMCEVHAEVGRLTGGGQEGQGQNPKAILGGTGRIVQVNETIWSRNVPVFIRGRLRYLADSL